MLKARPALAPFRQSTSPARQDTRPERAFPIHEYA